MGSTSAGILRDALRWGNESLKIMSLQLGQSAGASTADSSNGQNLLDPSYESNGDDGDQQSLFPSNNNGNLLAALVNGSMLLNESENLLSSSDNQTYSEMEPSFPSYIRTTSTLLCGIILFIGIVGNILVPIVVWRNKELRSSTNIFLVNLSLADLLILLVCMPPVLIELHSKPEVWVLGATMCKFSISFFELSQTSHSLFRIWNIINKLAHYETHNLFHDIRTEEVVFTNIWKHPHMFFMYLNWIAWFLVNYKLKSDTL